MQQQDSSVTIDFESIDSKDASDVVGLVKAGGNDVPYLHSCNVQFAGSGTDLGPVVTGRDYFGKTLGSRSLTGDTATACQLAVADAHSTRPTNATKIRRARRKVQCRYCFELFDPELGRGHGKCPDAPDWVMEQINIASCAWVTNAVMYHCFSDAEGDYEPACTCSDLTGRSLIKWTVVMLMSICLPCLCCFWPLIGCRRCALSCGYCVPYHKAI